MSGFSRINPDVIDLGTQQIAGVTSRLFASARSPFDGLYSAVVWADATNYIAGQAITHRGNVYNAVTTHLSNNGVNDPDSDTYDVFGVGAFWKKVDGKDGDMWFRVSGSASSTYQKINNAWVQLTPNFAGAAVSLNDSAVGDLAFVYPAAAFRSASIEIFIQSPGGNYERLNLRIVNDGVDAYGTEYAISTIGTDLEIEFLYSISGSNVEVRYNSSATPTGRTLLYLLRP
jgi:hypothetical protein